MILYQNRGPVLNFIQPPQEEPPVEYESLLLPPERPKKTRSRESSRRRRRRRAEEAENQSPPGGNNGVDPIEEYRRHRKRKGGRCECCYKHSIFADSPPKGGPPDGGLHRTNLKCSFKPQLALGNAAHSKT